MPQASVQIAALCTLYTLVYAFGSVTPATMPAANDGLTDMLTRMHQEGGPDTVILVAGNGGSSDGRIIAGFAELAPRRPDRILVRAVKLFANSDWNGDDYSLRVTTPSQVTAELDRDGISLIALDISPRWGIQWPHQSVLLAALETNSDRAELIYSSGQGGYRLYRFHAANSPRVPDILLRDLRTKMQDTLFRAPLPESQTRQ